MESTEVKALNIKNAVHFHERHFMMAIMTSEYRSSFHVNDLKK